METFRDRLTCFLAAIAADEDDAAITVRGVVQRLIDTAVPAESIVPAIDAALGAEPVAYARVLLSRARDAAIGDYVPAPNPTPDR